MISFLTLLNKDAMSGVPQNIFQSHGAGNNIREFSTEEAASYYHSLALSKDKVRKVRQYLAAKDIDFQKIFLKVRHIFLTRSQDNCECPCYLLQDLLQTTNQHSNQDSFQLTQHYAEWLRVECGCIWPKENHYR